jgi:hypothetical protein
MYPDLPSPVPSHPYEARHQPMTKWVRRRGVAAPSRIRSRSVSGFEFDVPQIAPTSVESRFTVPRAARQKMIFAAN